MLGFGFRFIIVVVGLDCRRGIEFATLDTFGWIALIPRLGGFCEGMAATY